IVDGKEYNLAFIVLSGDLIIEKCLTIVFDYENVIWNPPPQQCRFKCTDRSKPTTEASMLLSQFSSILWRMVRSIPRRNAMLVHVASLGNWSLQKRTMHTAKRSAMTRVPTTGGIRGVYSHPLYEIYSHNCQQKPTEVEARALRPCDGVYNGEGYATSCNYTCSDVIGEDYVMNYQDDTPCIRSSDEVESIKLAGLCRKGACVEPSEIGNHERKQAHPQRLMKCKEKENRRKMVLWNCHHYCQINNAWYSGYYSSNLTCACHLPKPTREHPLGWCCKGECLKKPHCGEQHRRSRIYLLATAPTFCQGAPTRATIEAAVIVSSGYASAFIETEEEYQPLLSHLRVLFNGVNSNLKMTQQDILDVRIAVTDVVVLNAYTEIFYHEFQSGSQYIKASTPAKLLQFARDNLHVFAGTDILVYLSSKKISFAYDETKGHDVVRGLAYTGAACTSSGGLIVHVNPEDAVDSVTAITHEIMHLSARGRCLSNQRIAKMAKPIRSKPAKAHFERSKILSTPIPELFFRGISRVLQ
ncbi:hypothetical protein MTO96_030716, partial [Rhipicephalus appendiculatus]